MKIHSEVNLITNSSSELFIVKLLGRDIGTMYQFKNELADLINSDRSIIKNYDIYSKAETMLDECEQLKNAKFLTWDWDIDAALLTAVFTLLDVAIDDKEVFSWESQND